MPHQSKRKQIQDGGPEIPYTSNTKSQVVPGIQASLVKAPSFTPQNVQL